MNTANKLTLARVVMIPLFLLVQIGRASCRERV